MSGDAKKVAIVTGSTQGLGEAIARRLVDEALIGGLVICGRNAENGDRLAREFTQRGCRTEFVRADLAAVEDCRRVAETARRRLTASTFWSTAPPLPARHDPRHDAASFLTASWPSTCVPRFFSCRPRSRP